MSIINAFRTLGLIGILTIAVLRCMIVFAPQVVFDVDPVLDPVPLLGMGPAGSLLLDALLLLACAIALLGEWSTGRGLNALILMLALTPLPIIYWHGSIDAGDFWLGGTWLAAAVACASLAHLARDRTFRIIIMAVLLAVVAPVIARGLVQMYHEHPATIEFYEQHKDEILRERGWPPDSSAAQIFERRLREPQPLGWFSTANITASLMAAALVMFIGLAVAAVRARMQSGWIGAMILAAIACGFILWQTGSKGATLATLAGVCILVTASRLPRLGLPVIALIILSLVGVIIRGAILPEDFAGDRSLLFRWHYMIAAARIMVEQFWLGVGPDGFQAAYMLHRVPRNPEEVASAHSVFTDWVSTLGVCGATWIGLIIAVLLRGGRLGADTTSAFIAAESSAPTSMQHSHILKNVRMSSPARIVVASRGDRFVLIGLAIVVLAFVPALIIEWPSIDTEGLRARLLGVLGFAGVAFVVATIMRRAADDTARVAWFGGIAALLVHAQIEMTFTQPGAAVWCMCAIGAIGLGAGGEGARSPRVLSPRRAGGARFVKIALNVIAIAAIVCSAGWIAFNGVVPAMRQQRTMLAAAAILEPLRSQPDDVQLMLKLRGAAAEELVRTYEQWPINVQPLNAAAIQIELACSQPGGPQPIGLLLRGRDLLDIAILRHGKSSSMAIAVGVNVLLARLTDDAEHWSRAIELSSILTQRDPHGLSAWKRLGDVLWAAGQRAEAAEAYQRALECDANFALDELKQLSDEDRRRIDARITEASAL